MHKCYHPDQFINELLRIVKNISIVNIILLHCDELKNIKMKIQLLLVIIALSIFEVNVAQIRVNGYVEIGYITERSALNQIGEVVTLYYPNAGYSDLTLNFSRKGWGVEQQIYNVFGHSRGSRTFKPLDILYKTRLKYKWKGISIGYEHMCLHPIINQHNELEIITRRRSHDKLFLRFNFGNF